MGVLINGSAFDYSQVVGKLLSDMTEESLAVVVLSADSREQCVYFVNAMTRYSGRSSQLALQMIQAMQRDGSALSSFFIQDPASHFAVYPGGIKLDTGEYVGLYGPEDCLLTESYALRAWMQTPLLSIERFNAIRALSENPHVQHFTQGLILK